MDIAAHSYARNYAGSPAPAGVLSHPGMLSKDERRFLYNCVVRDYKEGTAIIDAGVFLGASTRAICTALRERGITDRCVHSYEYGIFNGNTALAATRMLKRQFKAGDSFRDVLTGQLTDYADLIAFHFGDICEADAAIGRPVSILFLDVMKDARISDHAARTFFPMLTDGAIVIHQDYFHPQHPWIQFVMAVHKDQFEYLGKPETGGRINSAIFRARRIDAERIRSALHEFGKSRDYALQMMDEAIAFHTDPVERFLTCGSRAAVQAWFDRDAKKAANDFFAVTAEFGVAHLALDPEQDFHVRRIVAAIRRFSGRTRSWV